MKEPKKRGAPKKNNVPYHRNINPSHVKPMDEYLNKLKDKENGNSKTA